MLRNIIAITTNKQASTTLPKIAKINATMENNVAKMRFLL